MGILLPLFSPEDKFLFKDQLWHTASLAESVWQAHWTNISESCQVSLNLLAAILDSFLRSPKIHCNNLFECCFVEEFTPYHTPDGHFAHLWHAQQQPGRRINASLESRFYCLWPESLSTAWRRAGSGSVSLGLFGIQAKWVKSLSEKRELSSEILQVLRLSPSQKWVKNGKDDSLGSLLDTTRQPTRVLRQYAQRYVHKQLHCASGAKTHQEVSFSRTALNSINHQGPENMYLQGGGSADNPPFPNHKWINTVWYRLQRPWHPRRRVSGGTHWVSFCLSYRFNPNMCAERWAGWLKNFQKYTWCPKSINHTVTLLTAANSTLSFLPMTSCSANHWAGHRKHKVACDNCPPPPSRLFREGKGEAEITPVGPAAGLPAVHKALTSARGHGRCSTVATEGQSQSHFYRGRFVQSVFDLTRQGLVGWSGPDGQGLEPN